jgi:hypothetical protein
MVQASFIGGCPMTAWLHRRGKPSWMFTPSQQYGELVHITNRGTVYAIFADHQHGKPFWVGRLCGSVWITVEDQLSAHSIEFDGAGVYTFQKALK